MIGFNRRFRRALREHLAAVRDIAALPWEQLPDAALLRAIARMVEMHQRLDPLVGLANGYASAFMDMLQAQLRNIAGERAPSLRARSRKIMPPNARLGSSSTPPTWSSRGKGLAASCRSANHPQRSMARCGMALACR